MTMKYLSLRSAAKYVYLTLLFSAPLFAQVAPPPQRPADGGSYASVSGAISQLNYGPEMEITSFLVNRNTLVTFPPHVGWTVSSALKVGENVEVTGYGSVTASGLSRIDLVSISAGGRTFSVPQPGQFTSYTGSGTVTQLNYNREGDMDGFLLSNRVFVKTPPPFGTTLTSLVAVGSQVSVSGYSHQAPVGVKITNGQDIRPAVYDFLKKALLIRLGGWIVLHRNTRK